MGEEGKAEEKKRWEDKRGMDRPAFRQVPEGGGEQRKMEETGSEVICDVSRTPMVMG